VRASKKMKIRISARGQITLPARFRQMDGIKAGQQFEVERLDAGEYFLVRESPHRNEGLIDLFLSCPVKGFFAPISSESTDKL
jgi:AbrB family looped-hinge helix DNA binding protein